MTGSTVGWNGSARPTTFVSATVLQATIGASDIAAAGTIAVTVVNPAPGGGTSNAVTFTVASAPSPAPVVGALGPPSVPAGSPRFTLTVTGTGFAPSSAVVWNGNALPTTLASASELHATVESTDVASPGSPGGGTSATLPFTITPATAVSLGPAVAYQIDPAHSGRAVFGSALSFPTSPTWTTTLEGAISYPLIVGGKVLVLAAGSATGGSGTQLYALDEATGTQAWGPVAIAGAYAWAGHAYDGGKVFVVNFDGLLQSFDAATGEAGFSVNLPGQSAFSAPPTAASGIVYVGGAGVGGTVYAVEETYGAVLWT